MKMLRKVLFIILGVIVLFIVFTMFLPSKVHVQRDAVINAPVEKVFAQINDLHQWVKWNPWTKLDPKMKMDFYGPEAGTGSGYKWQSDNSKVGSGDMKISKSIPNESIATELNFGDRGKGTSGFVFEKSGEGTKITWSMDSDMGMNPIGRFMGLFMDKMLGSQFEDGLKNLQEINQSK